MLDYDVELGISIGKPAKGVSEASARNHVIGYLVANDVSAREWPRHPPASTRQVVRSTRAYRPPDVLGRRMARGHTRVFIPYPVAAVV